jgi:3D (Asp-Asp-Asp) domain-containing protein
MLKHVIIRLLILFMIILGLMLYSNFKTNEKLELYQTKNNIIMKELETQKSIVNSIKKNEEVKNQKIKELEDENKKIILKCEEYSKENAALENTIKKYMSIGAIPQNYKLPEKSNRGAYDRHSGKMTYVGEWLCTYYAPVYPECPDNKGITRSGEPIIPAKTIAIDPKYWKFGQKFYIDGIGTVVCNDTGGAIKGRNRADIATFNLKVSNSGSFKARVYLIEE